ncbi:MAG: hypothetical protein ACXVAX_04875 [Pseudobdellovibrio sp.]
MQKAYAWLLNQSASVKDMATTQDILVSMYLKAQRSGDAALETPSIQNFKQELKNLASMIGDLQTPSQSSQPNTSTSFTTPLPTYSSSAQPVVQPSSSMPQTFVVGPVSSNSGSNTSGGLNGLDEQSKLAIMEVKAALNLSSDTEALRALISLGYKHFKKINS